METLPISERLIAPLRGALAGEAAEWPALTNDEARALASRGVGPLVYSIARIPRLRDQAMQAAAVEPMRLDDLRIVLDALASHGVDALLMKGTPLAYELYPAPELRPRGDTDLLIPHASVEAARTAMLALGFEERITSGDEHGLRQMLFTRRDAFGIDHAYDVHWSIVNRPLLAQALRFDELRARAVPVPVISSQAMGLCPVDALLLACIHRVAHHHDSDRLIWLVDVALLRDRMSRAEHEEFWRLAAERGVAGVCMRAVELTEEWCGRTTHSFPDFVDGDEPSRVYLDRDISYGRTMLSDFRAMSWRARVQRLWQLALPPAEFMRRRFHVRSRFALPWLYVYRGARGIVRLFRLGRRIRA
ncbi:MAG TPA: nucleotidyltransferase family protein [Thermoanaerobaculia bacterium]|nr:nucleotidyltransferase family protein [Thermoanaerobaculia bacterium]